MVSPVRSRSRLAPPPLRANLRSTPSSATSSPASSCHRPRRRLLPHSFGGSSFPITRPPPASEKLPGTPPGTSSCGRAAVALLVLCLSSRCVDSLLRAVIIAYKLFKLIESNILWWSVFNPSCNCKILSRCLVC